MSDPNTHINYSVEDIERYLSGGMSAKEMHDMEKAALQDPFLADAIEGFGNTSFEESRNHLNEIMAALQRNKEMKVITRSSVIFRGYLSTMSDCSKGNTISFLVTCKPIV